MNYLDLKEKIFSISQKMFPQIYDDMDKSENKQYHYYFSLVNEIFRGISLCCVAIDLQAYAQIGTLLRQLIEQVATACVIGQNEKNISSYRVFAKAKQYYIENHEDDTELRKLYDASKLSKNQKGKLLDYYSLGWLELIGAEKISYEKLMELAGLSDLVNWRSFCNNFVHTNITYMQFTQEGMLHTSIEFVYILAALLDTICCSYHNVTNFNFIYNKVNVFEEFRKCYAEITAVRNSVLRSK